MNHELQPRYSDEPFMIRALFRRHAGSFTLLLSLLLVVLIYWPGLTGGWLFDDYPNIVDNNGVQPASASISNLFNAALSSPSSEFKRPLASLSFAANYLAVGLDPYWWKLTNLLIHLLNGVLVFLLARLLLRFSLVGAHLARVSPYSIFDEEKSPTKSTLIGTGSFQAKQSRAGIVAAIIAASWMLLPINLTGVLYVVQRMESIANIFVLLGLVGYVYGRRRMLTVDTGATASIAALDSNERRGFLLCLLSITLPAVIGMLAKETAVMLPLYALLIEWALFRFRTRFNKRDRRILGSFLVVLWLPMLIGIGWLLPGLLKPEAWATRDFTLGTRLLSEARIVVDYVGWTLWPASHALSFYHDDFRISTGLLTPWTTLASLVFLSALVALLPWLRARRPLAALGIALFLGCQLLTGTVLPLELIYEHRNYFASFGLLLAIVPLLAAPSSPKVSNSTSSNGEPLIESQVHLPGMIDGIQPHGADDPLPMSMPRYVLMGGLILCWATLTALTAYAWGDPLRLAQALAERAPLSPRAQYELGRTYIIHSHYDPVSPFTPLAYAALEKAAALPKSSILPEQALIFMNARMKLPLKNAWWDSMIMKLKAQQLAVQDESSLGALTQCVRDHQCELPEQRMIQAYSAAFSHPHPSARLMAMYSDYAWNVLDDKSLGERMIAAAVQANPSEPAYQITLVRMLAAKNRTSEAKQALKRLERLNIGGRLDPSLAQLRNLQALQ